MSRSMSRSIVLQVGGEEDARSDGTDAGLLSGDVPGRAEDLWRLRRPWCKALAVTSTVLALATVAALLHRGTRWHFSEAMTAGTSKAIGLSDAAAGHETVMVSVRLRDFRRSHPNMESEIQGHEKGIVKPTLGRDLKPVFKGGKTVTTEADFQQWYNDVEGVNVPVDLDLRLTKNETGTFVFDKEEFFPLDGKGWNDKGYHDHNYYFTLEMHHPFTYHGGEEFYFRGDDDMWVFFDDKLVVDLGGTHLPLEASVDLDELDFKPGQHVMMHIFYAERAQVGSHCQISTTIKLDEDPCANFTTLRLKSVVQNDLGMFFGTEGLVYDAEYVEADTGKKTPVQLQVTVAQGSKYVPGNESWNGLFGKYAAISVKAGSEVQLKIRIRDPETKEPVQLNNLDLTFFDLDTSVFGLAKEYLVLQDFDKRALTKDTEINETENGSGVRFEATSEGNGTDNPYDVAALTDQQRNRAVTVRYRNTSEVDVTLGVTFGDSDRMFHFVGRPSLLCTPGHDVQDVIPDVQTTTVEEVQSSIEIVTDTVVTSTTLGATEEYQCCFFRPLGLMCYDHKPWFMLFCRRQP